MAASRSCWMTSATTTRERVGVRAARSIGDVGAVHGEGQRRRPDDGPLVKVTEYVSFVSWATTFNCTAPSGLTTWMWSARAACAAASTRKLPRTTKTLRLFLARII